ncbi:hypothetical protein P7K49_006553 [Saguinus oedipus]|uniref:Uncharacterized protein n=1 Tax=Saguinus oedipus TaxID=9490 RepID=A0ABQ9W6E2_SAGOE|nr:hypothetical protein P7K49_006553 [Saguinus oedipus]
MWSVSWPLSAWQARSGPIYQLGFLAVLTEAMMYMSQLYCNYCHRSSEDMSIQSTHKDKGNALRTTCFLQSATHAALGLLLLQVLVVLAILG